MTFFHVFVRFNPDNREFELLLWDSNIVEKNMLCWSGRQVVWHQGQVMVQE